MQPSYTICGCPVLIYIPLPALYTHDCCMLLCCALPLHCLSCHRAPTISCWTLCVHLQGPVHCTAAAGLCQDLWQCLPSFSWRYIRICAKGLGLQAALGMLYCSLGMLTQRTPSPSLPILHSFHSPLPSPPHLPSHPLPFLHPLPLTSPPSSHPLPPHIPSPSHPLSPHIPSPLTSPPPSHPLPPHIPSPLTSPHPSHFLPSPHLPCFYSPAGTEYKWQWKLSDGPPSGTTMEGSTEPTLILKHVRKQRSHIPYSL